MKRSGRIFFWKRKKIGFCSLWKIEVYALKFSFILLNPSQIDLFFFLEEKRPNIEELSDRVHSVPIYKKPKRLKRSRKHISTHESSRSVTYGVQQLELTRTYFCVQKHFPSDDFI